MRLPQKSDIMDKMDNKFLVQVVISSGSCSFEIWGVIKWCDLTWKDAIVLTFSHASD